MTNYFLDCLLLAMFFFVVHSSTKLPPPLYLPERTFYRLDRLCEMELFEMVWIFEREMAQMELNGHFGPFEPNAFPKTISNGNGLNGRK